MYTQSILNEIIKDILIALESGIPVQPTSASHESLKDAMIDLGIITQTEIDNRINE